ncbi:hypothetical protein [Nocardiopsis synnemataformans]|uniref:hypothetical protein n=1 Tax=Nocardiopsis synnemataformans TaxID=61305 RepID=UPI003EBC31EC
MPRFTVTLSQIDKQPPTVVEVGADADWTGGAPWHHERVRLWQIRMDASTPQNAILSSYDRHPQAAPWHVTQPLITREAAAQLTAPLCDRTALRALLANGDLPHLSDEHAPALFVGLDSLGVVLDHGTWSEAGQHPDTSTVVGVRPGIPRTSTAPLSGLWVPAHVYSPDVLGSIPALVDVLQNVSPHVINPLFTPEGAAVYLESVQSWNAHVAPPCRVRLFGQGADGALAKTDPRPSLLDEEDHVLRDEFGAFIGPHLGGLYTMPLPRIARGWHLATGR